MNPSNCQCQLHQHQPRKKYVLESLLSLFVLEQCSVWSLISFIFLMKSIECLILVQSDLVLLPSFQVDFSEVLLSSWADDLLHFLLSLVWGWLVILSSFGERDREERLGRLLDTDSLYLLILLLQIGLRIGTGFLAFCLNICSSSLSNRCFLFYWNCITMTIHLLWYILLSSHL